MLAELNSFISINLPHSWFPLNCLVPLLSSAEQQE